MPVVSQPPRRVRFGEFTVDLDSGEISDAARKLILQDKPLHLLAALLERPGHLITRDELKRKLWNDDTFVDFDHSLNKAVNRLRAALSDDAARPRYIETVPRRGYRFIANLRDLAPLRDNFRRPRPVTLLVIAVFLVCLVACVSLARFVWPLDAGVSVGTFTKYPGEESYPSFSPDGKQLVFRWDGGDSGSPDRWDLYVRAINGPETPRRLTWHPAASLVPAWSPDGEYVAFTRSEFENSGLYLIPARGGSERKLTGRARLAWIYGMLAWSADSKWLAYADLEEPASDAPARTRIHLMNIETLEKRVLPHPAPDCIASWVPAFSPDGTKLAFACQTSVGVNHIFIEGELGGPPHQVADLRGDFRGITWAADSNSLIYSLDRSLWRVRIDAGSQQKLPFAHDALQPAVAARGNRLAYSRQIDSSSIWRLFLRSPGGPLTGALKLIGSNPGQGESSVSPDGRRIAFQSSRSGATEIWVCESDGSGAVQLTHLGPAMTGSPHWSPDSRKIVFDSRVSGQSQIYVVSASGGPVTGIPTGNESASEPFWSADGKWIFFSAEKSGGIWKTPVAGGESVRLSTQVGLPKQAADGSRLYYARYTQHGAQLWSVGLNGAGDQPVNDMPSLRIADQWSPARAGIYFVNAYRSPPALELFIPSTRQITQVADLHGKATDWGAAPSVSADGRTIVYTEPEQIAGNIMLVEGFH
jgi:Tol biopolymer transport system component/DNA-binding winged helix-turn-helix (wHTH) protein